MEFYKVWRSWGGTFGVHKMTLGDLFMNYIIVVLVYLVLLGLFVTILPTILVGFYLLWIINSDMENGESEECIQQRQVLMILAVISVVYFLIDFHFGLVAFKIIGTATYSDTMDGIAVYNLALGFVSVLLFFLGHTVYSLSPVRLGRIVLILALVWFGYKFSKAISRPIISNVVTQCVDDEAVNSARQSYIDHERYENGEYVP